MEWLLRLVAQISTILAVVTSIPAIITTIAVLVAGNVKWHEEELPPFKKGIDNPALDGDKKWIEEQEKFLQTEQPRKQRTSVTEKTPTQIKQPKTTKTEKPKEVLVLGSRIPLENENPQETNCEQEEDSADTKFTETAEPEPNAELPKELKEWEEALAIKKDFETRHPDRIVKIERIEHQGRGRKPKTPFKFTVVPRNPRTEAEDEIF